MVDMFSLVFPIFALIVIGYGLVVSGLIPKDVGSALSKFVFSVPLPLLLFRTLATSNIADQTPWALWGAYFLCVFTIWALGMLVVRFGFGRQGSVLAVAGISSGFSNLVLLGIPVISGVFGEEALVPLVMLLTIHLPVMMLMSSLIVEWYGREQGVSINFGAILIKVANRLVHNPVIVGIVIGGLCGLLELPIPDLASAVIDKIVPVTVPLALISMGMSMHAYGLSGDIVPAILLGLLKTVVFPALFLLVSTTIFPLPVEWVAVIVLGAASPTGVNAYLLADHFGVGHRLSANTISLSVLMGFVTLPFWISVATGLMAP